MQRIGLTGGIAAGKSTASQAFAELGAVVIDYDILSREAVAPGSPVLTQIANEFGPDVIDPSGNLNRDIMAQRIFTDPAARQSLENFIHPRVYELAAELESRAVSDNPDAIVIHDVPLLVEQKLADQFDGVVIVQTNRDIREQRLVDARGLSPEQARARIAAGATDAERETVGTYRLDGSQSPDDMRNQVAKLWQKLGGGR